MWQTNDLDSTDCSNAVELLYATQCVSGCMRLSKPCVWAWETRQWECHTPNACDLTGLHACIYTSRKQGVITVSITNIMYQMYVSGLISNTCYDAWCNVDTFSIYNFYCIYGCTNIFNCIYSSSRSSYACERS